MNEPVQDHNRTVWNERVRQGKTHTKTVLPKDLQNPLPILDPESWLGGEVRGKRALCLASGGGLQSGLLAAAGAVVTVLDISDEMLRLDIEISRKHGFDIKTVRGSMDDLRCFSNESFEIVLQPVSSCYIPDIAKMYAEVGRVICGGGIYISQHKQPVSLQASAVSSASGYLISEPYYRTGPLPPVPFECEHRESGAIEFLHRWEQLLGEMCRQGFVIEDIVEPVRQSGGNADRTRFIAPYVKIKARKLSKSDGTSALWLPREAP